MKLNEENSIILINQIKECFEDYPRRGVQQLKCMINLLNPDLVEKLKLKLKGLENEFSTKIRHRFY